MYTCTQQRKQISDELMFARYTAAGKVHFGIEMNNI